MARQTYNQLWFFSNDAKFSRSLKMQIFEGNVLSRVVWGAEGWLLAESIQAKLNGWCSISTVSDREFESLSDTVEFFDLLIFL